MLRLLRTVLVVALAAAAIFLIASLADGSENDNRAEAAGRALVDPGTAPARVPRRPPVVMLLLDEFPVDAMLGPDGRIDAVRYPNFAALAASGTWFRNASTVYDSTTRAIPEVVDGKLPSRSGDSTFRTHPRSVFDLFGRRGYRVVESEEATSLCPPRYCRGARPRRPAILLLLQAGRRERIDRFIASIRRGRPTFYFKHALLPHGPYQFLPSGKQTRRSFRDAIPGMNSPPGFGERFLSDHNHQRLLLQIGFADHELGRLFTRLNAQGILDQAMIVVAADHGMAFEVGVEDRRTATAENIDEIAPVPLFIKAPGQRRGKVDRSYVRTIDIVPTMADILNLRLPYRADGHSAFSRAVRGRRFVRMIKRDFSGTLTISARSLERRRRGLVRRKLHLYGSGDLRTLYTGIGPNRRLIGRTTAELRPAGLGKIRATIAAARDLRAVNPRSVILPTQIAGPVRGGKRGRRRDVAVAVNGIIEAVGRTFYLRGNPTEGFAMMVPETSLRPGRNTVEVFEVSDGGRRLRLIGRV